MNILQEIFQKIYERMLASTLGIPFDIDAAYDEKREIFMLSDQIVETKNITSCATV